MLPDGIAGSRANRFVIALTAGVLAALTLSPPGALASSLQHTYRFDASALTIEASDNGVALAAGSLPSTWEAGQPEIPYQTVTLLVPRGSRVAGVVAHPVREHLAAEEVALTGATARYDSDGRRLAPRTRPWRVGGPAKASRVYPPVLAESAGQGSLHGYQFIVLNVYPVRYEAAAGRVWVADEIELQVELADGGTLPLERERYSAAIEDNAKRTVERLVANPEKIDSYERRIGTRSEATERGFHPTDAPSLEGSPVSYVIITNEAMASAFQVLADWKSRRGIPTVVRTKQWIESNYRHGSDIQETIRNFICDAYTKWGVEYVALGGDTDVIPARYGYSEFAPAPDEFVPTDMYFACLDGNWNADGDGVWGEAASDSLNLVDETDKYAEVYIGRLPVSDATEASALIDKIMEYENPSITDYQDEVLMLAEVLFPVDWAPGQAVALDGAFYSELVRAYISSCATTTRLYQNQSQYAGSLPLTLAATLQELDQGCGFVNHIGHGFRYNMSVGDQSLVNAHAASLTNGNRRFVLYMLNCTATAFDFPCLAEEYLKASGGAVAVFGASRAAFPIPVANYNREFFVSLYVDSIPNAGKTFVESRLNYTANSLFDNADHYSHYLYNYLGDPEMIIHTCELATTAVTHPAAVTLGSNNVLVHVTNDGMPRGGARVCLQKGVEEYVYGLTDANGDVTLEFVAESAGTIDITVSGANMTTWMSTMNVDATGGAYVHATTIAVDDDNLGGSLGNGDGVIDGGEIVQLTVTFRNDGDSGATNVTGVCRVASPHAAVLDSSYTVGTVGVGDSVGAAGIRILLAVSAPDEVVVPLEFSSTDGFSQWIDVINKVVHAPRMELTHWTIQDSAPGGNGDGVIQAGETFDLIPSVKNYGTGAAPALYVDVFNSDPDLIFTTTHLDVGDVALLQEVTQAPGFRVTENTLAENVFNVRATDARSRIWTWNVSLRGPAAPAGPTLDASQDANAVVATWTPSSEPDLAGYHLYRSTSGSGPWTRLTVDRTVLVAYFRDGGVQGSTTYYYYATAVDSSGNESPPSPVTSVNTQPPQLAGWPIAMGAESSCPPVVADITGDGVKEILAGNDVLYAWDWHGTELKDDDNDPQTWGIFVGETDVITAALVAAEFDDDPGFEAFVTSWEDSNAVYLVHGDGSIAPGWPQMPDPLTAQTGFWAAPLAVDVDGDGYCEVFAAGKNGNLYAWRADGTPLGASANWKSGLGTWSRCSPVAANLDSDPYPEVIYMSPTGTLYAWNADGSNVPNFPVVLGTLCQSSPAVGDVNNDGIPDIVVQTDGTSTGKVNVVNSRTGAQLPGWPKTLSQSNNLAPGPSPALADFDFDGYLEIVVANNDANIALTGVRVYDYQGNVKTGWPRTTNLHSSESSPIVADVSGDGIPDILFGNEDGKIFGWDRDGNNLAGFPLSVGDFVRSTPFADDVDGDGDIDMVLAGWDKNLWIWDFNAPFSKTAAQWPTFQHDPERTGNYTHRAQTPTNVGDPGNDMSAAVPRRPMLSQNVPNPFNPVTTISYGVPATSEGRIPVSLRIYDVQGRKVRDLVQGDHEPGTFSALWDGRDESGRRVHSGVYFYRLQVGVESLTRKMTVVK